MIVPRQQSPIALAVNFFLAEAGEGSLCSPRLRWYEFREVRRRPCGRRRVRRNRHLPSERSNPGTASLKRRTGSIRGRRRGLLR
jgi:hypothetical protein